MSRKMFLLATLVACHQPAPAKPPSTAVPGPSAPAREAPEVTELSANEREGYEGIIVGGHTKLAPNKPYAVPFRVEPNACIAAAVDADNDEAKLTTAFGVPGGEEILQQVDAPGPLVFIQTMGGCWRNQSTTARTIELRLESDLGGQVKFVVHSVVK